MEDQQHSWVSLAVAVASVLVSFFACLHFFMVKKKKKKNDHNGSEVTAAEGLQSISTTQLKLPEGCDYEVFLSFRGTDTRTSFTDFLYTSLVDAGIWVFRDDDELRVGEEIGPELLNAIKKSKISIPIISTGYASSKWCLIELVQMMECRKKEGQLVLPIFYKLEPSDVRHQTGNFGKAFHDLLKKHYTDETVQGWRAALRDITTLKGWESKKIANGHEGELTKIIVLRVLSELKKAFLFVTEQLVGVDDHVETIMGMLDVKADDIRYLGIHGMGGIGKTTIAKVIYNQLSNHFYLCSFLADIRETSQKKGIEHLQNQLISDILKRKCEDITSADEGISIIRSRFKGKKVLILLDDVDDRIQLKALAGKHEWFGPGSRIIITTRNKDAINVPEVEWTYELKEMDFSQSMQLFSRHAFRRDYPHRDYDIVSNEIVSMTGGLPLALEIVGSLLSGKAKAEWEGTLKKLRKIPRKEVQKKLRISYDALDHEQQQIFLDIACLLVGRDRRIAAYMWDDCNLYPEEGVGVLVRMSLIKIGENNELRMHDQLRDLGREIVREENYLEPRKRSRLWTQEEAFNVLDAKKVATKVQGILLDLGIGSKGCCFTSEQFEKLPSLRFLQLNYANLSGDFNYILSELRWLHWLGCPLTFMVMNFCLKNLVILDLSHSEVSEHWSGWAQILMAKKLKVLNLTSCIHLTTTPDLSSLDKLEILIFEKCENLEKIHPSIGELKKLISLNMRNCGKLKELPTEVSTLEELQELLIDGTPIREIPILMGSLKKLEILTASYCKTLSHLPSSLGGLTSLANLHLSSSPNLAELPDSLGSVVSLHCLSLSGCHSLRKIPDGIGKLEVLTELDLTGTGIEELPDSIGNLHNLKMLYIGFCSITKLTSAIGMLQKLEELVATGCRSLQGEVPAEISNLPLLKILQLDYTGICGLPISISRLSSLEKLDLWGCLDLKLLPHLPSSLTALRFNCTSMQGLPSFSNLNKLKGLHFSNCFKMDSRQLDFGSSSKLEILTLFDSDFIPEDMGSLSQLKTLSLFKVSISYLPADICALSRLQDLDVSKCQELKHISELPSSLVKLRLAQCPMLKTLPDLSNLTCLSELKLNECSDLTEIKGLGGLESLRVLGASGCRKLSKLDGLEHLESLRCLLMAWCEAIQRLPDLSKLTKIRELFAPSCKNLAELQLCDSMKCLESLHLRGCTSIETLTDLSYLKMLRDLDVKDCDNLRVVEGLNKLTSLVRLNISGCKSLVKFPDLSELMSLEELRMQDHDELTEIPGLERLNSLRYLEISRCKSIEALPHLSALSNLQHLEAQDCKKLKLRGIETLKFLTFLDVSGCESLEELPELPDGIYVER